MVDTTKSSGLTLADRKIRAAERVLLGIALRRQSWLFVGSGRGGERAGAVYSLTVTAKMNDTDPQASLADLIIRLEKVKSSPQVTSPFCAI